MHTQPDVSIIIPAYNIEKYIGTTLESAIAQHGITMEILVVDDHSTDGTRKVLEKYCSKYPFIKLLTNERSKGIGGARNTALTHMKGKACFFLDGDDILMPDSLAPLYKHLQKNKSALVRSKMVYFCHQRNLFLFSKKVNLYQFPSSFFSLHLYDGSIIKNNDIFFPEDCTVGEDCCFINKFCCISKFEAPVAFVDDYSYIYRINYKPAHISAKNALSFIKHISNIQNQMESYSKSNKFAECFQYLFVGIWLNYAYYALQDSENLIHNYLKNCAELLGAKEEELKPLLKAQLQEQSEPFWQACKSVDTKAMLEALEKTGLLQPIDYTYMGIKESQAKSKYWKFIRFLHRIRNMTTDFNNAKHLWYIYCLHKKSNKFLSA